MGTAVAILFDRRDTATAARLRRQLLAFKIAQSIARETATERRPINRAEMVPLVPNSAPTLEGDVDTYIFVCSPSLASNKSADAVLQASAVILPVIAAGDPNVDRNQKGARTCFSPAMARIVHERDLLAIDLRRGGDGWRDGIAKVVARATGLGLGALRDRERENERRQLWLLGAMLVGLAITVVAAIGLYSAAITAGQAMDESLVYASALLDYSASDLRQFVRVRGPASAEAVKQMRRIEQQNGRVAAIMENTGALSDVTPLLWATAKLYLADGLRARGEYDEALAMLDATRQIILDPRFHMPTNGAAETLAFRQSFLHLRAQTYRIAGDELASAQAEREIANLAQNAAVTDQAYTSAIRAQSLADALTAFSFTAQTRGQVEAAADSARAALESMHDGPIADPRFLTSVTVDQSIDDPKTYGEIKSALRASIELWVFSRAAAAGDLNWIATQRLRANQAVSALSADAGMRANRAESALRAANRNVAWLTSDLRSIETELQSELREARAASELAEDDVNARAAVADVLLLLGQAQAARRERSFESSLAEAVTIRRQLLADDPTNTLFKHELGQALVLYADGRIESGACDASTKASRTEGKALLSETAKSERRAVGWQRELAGATKTRTCFPGKWSGANGEPVLALAGAPQTTTAQ